MAAGEDGRLQVGRTFAAAPGWLRLAVILAVAALLGVVALLAGLPAQLAPLVIGGVLALMTALVTGFVADEDDE
jgi:hypothetical protein